MPTATATAKKKSFEFIDPIIQRYTGKPGALLGILSSAISQSTSLTTFILAGLTSSGMISVRSALPIWCWANVGSTVGV